MQDIRLRWLALALGSVALVLLAAGLASRWATPVGWALAALGGEYAVLFAAEGQALDELTPVYASAFVLVAELAYWSLERRIPAWSEEGLLVRRLAHLLIVCAAAGGVAALLLVAAAASRGGGIALEAVGVVAAIGALALVAALVRRVAAPT